MVYGAAFICSVISMVSTAISAIFFAIASLRTNEEIEKMCQIRLGGNPLMKKSLMIDRKNTQIGLCFLSIGVEFQIFSMYLQ
jgi:hypothetical protein